VPTATNLLGLVKHQTIVEMGYFGDTFGRPCPDPLTWDSSDPMSDMFAFSNESRAFITGEYRRAWAYSDATIDALPLDTIGHVPWWSPDDNERTLHHILVRVATDTNRTQATPTSSASSSTGDRPDRRQPQPAARRPGMVAGLLQPGGTSGPRRR
jgi:hypothetical protein